MPTRTIFFHISPLGQAIFYLLSFISVVICFYGFYLRFRLWRQGKPVYPVKDRPWRWKALFNQMFAHRRTLRRRYAGKMHLLIFFGMFVLFIGTNIVAVEHYGGFIFGEHWLYRGSFYLFCKIALDLFGLGLLVGVVMALARRYLRRPVNLGSDWKDGAFLLLLFAATLTGFLLEGAGLSSDPNRAAYAAYSPIGSLFIGSAHAMAGTSAGYALVWWVHTPLVLGVIAVLPYGRWLHLFVIPATIMLQPDRPMGALAPVSMEEVEMTGKIGLEQTTDMDRWQLMSLDGCMECGRCTDACPARAVGKELNPKQIILDLRSTMTKFAAPKSDPAQPAVPAGQNGLLALLSTDVISDESLWACTNCHACVRECPALIRHVDIIDGIRRYRVAEGRFSGSGATMLRQLTSRENPWGLPMSQRLDWTKGLDISLAAAGDDREVLLWVGCAGAFDPHAQKTTQALARLLQKAGVRFSILGSKERCTGDPARRTGDEFLFQQLAEANIATLNEIQARTIVTHCPHCLNTLKNEYPQMGGNYTVMHHTQYLAQLAGTGRLQVPKEYSESVTYHDPCFLARVNGITEAPRTLLNGAQRIPLIEAERRESRTFCCGAGGGRMWMEEPPNQRPGLNRARELLATGAKTVAVGCPFCKVMVGDSVAQAGGEGAPPIKDVAEIMLEAIEKAGSQNQ